MNDILAINHQFRVFSLYFALLMVGLPWTLFQQVTVVSQGQVASDFATRDRNVLELA